MVWLAKSAIVTVTVQQTATLSGRRVQSSGQFPLHTEGKQGEESLTNSLLVCTASCRKAQPAHNSSGGRNTGITSVRHTICNVSDVVCPKRRQEAPDLCATCRVLQCGTLASRVISHQDNLTVPWQQLGGPCSHITR